MKKMKLSVVTVVVFLVCCFASIPIVNDLTAKSIEKQLARVDLPENTELIESLSKAGKLVGNGNGMQYFGAILIRSEQTLEELSAYYSHELANVVVERQTAQKIEGVEHEELSFITDISQTEDYFIVYLFGDGIAPFLNLDIRGY